MASLPDSDLLPRLELELEVKGVASICSEQLEHRTYYAEVGAE